MSRVKSIWKKVNPKGVCVFFGTLILMGVLTVQGFGFWIKSASEELAIKNTIIVQEMNADSDCLLATICMPEADDTEEDKDIVIPVLMYHHIRHPQSFYTSRENLYSIGPERFERQLQELKDAGYAPITLELFEESLTAGTSVLPERPILLTFDDGYRSHAETAYPILKKIGFPATFFIYTDGIPLHGYMNEDMLRELADDPFMSIASHTVTHASLTRLSRVAREKELIESKEILEGIIGKPVTAFSYPSGAYTPALEKEVAAAGYTLAFRVGPGSKQSEDARYRIQRIQVLSWDDPVQLLAKYAGK